MSDGLTPLPLLFLGGPTATRGFTSVQSGRSRRRVPVRDRTGHSATLEARLNAAWGAAATRNAVAAQTRAGVYLEFSGTAGYDLVIKSLEDRRAGIRLLNVRHDVIAGGQRTRATVFVPKDRGGHFIRKVRQYADEQTAAGNAKHRTLIDSIDDVAAAILSSFWTDTEAPPGDQPLWVEAWLRASDTQTVETFRQLAERLGIAEHPHHPLLHFPERLVILIHATRDQLERLVEHSDDLAELRAAREPVSFLLNADNTEQVEWVRDLLSRTDIQEDSDTSVCILDTGINQGHPLLAPVLAELDLHSVREEWGTHDHHSHGTLMAGLVAYGDLQEALHTAARVPMLHRLESVKLLPPPPEENPPHLWGHVTAQAISRAEIQAPQRRRVVCMAVTAKETRRSGRPTSWSAEIDQLACGVDGGPRRLILVSAGNVDLPGAVPYPESNFASPVQDPGQAWNALTVGAFTDRTQLADPYLTGYEPLAPSGGLSPHSSTSATWGRTWPIKPEVLFEGGNVALAEDGSLYVADDLGLLSTWLDPTVGHFSVIRETSAATAQAAFFAARIMTEYPEAWPETVRGLTIHSSEWTETMRNQFMTGQGKSAFDLLLRSCGYGVPNLRRALYCLKNSVTLVCQAELQPFLKRPNGTRATKDMHLYRLPWPQAALLDLGAVEVRMRTTLSYFVEPGPGEIGWQERYRYASHGLRFEINAPGEAEDGFLARINRQDRDEELGQLSDSPTDRWCLGQQRNVGSIHSDTWIGRAADLATSHLIAVRPSIGWWRERAHLGKVESKCRYSLIVTIDTPTEDVDIYNVVAQQLGIGVPIPVEIAIG